MSTDQNFSELPPFPGRLLGKTALVTGAASGLGASISTRLAGEGASAQASQACNEQEKAPEDHHGFSLTRAVRHGQAEGVRLGSEFARFA